MPFRLATGGTEVAIGAASIVLTTLGGANLWQRIHTKHQPKAAATASALTQDPQLFSETDFTYIQRQCIKGPAKMSTYYGVWHSTKDCTLPKRDKRTVTLPLDQILYNEKNTVVGFKRMLVTEMRKAFFEQHLTSSVTEEKSSCAKFGQRVFPLVIVVKKNLCEPLTYNQI